MGARGASPSCLQLRLVPQLELWQLNQPTPQFLRSWLEQPSTGLISAVLAAAKARQDSGLQMAAKPLGEHTTQPARYCNLDQGLTVCQKRIWHQLSFSRRPVFGRPHVERVLSP